ncbi:DNA-3-methyladenine glycosylase [Candidatus Uhrbacteria bacterium]|nr:DNA-3-methyladenine glycosylase [Candidatus Uhrbacteria bacterium]
MPGRILLKPDFFNRPTVAVARDLLGKFLVRETGAGRTALMIREVEAYDGFGDRASHAHRGMTERNAPMFGPAGHWYVYLVYGMHWMLNVTTGPVGYPAAVLIRRLEGLDGPARLTRSLDIDRRSDGRPSGKASGLWIEDRGVDIRPSQYRRLPRVGVDYAGEWAKKPYRFVLRSPDRKRK